MQYQEYSQYTGTRHHDDGGKGGGWRHDDGGYNIYGLLSAGSGEGGGYAVVFGPLIFGIWQTWKKSVSGRKLAFSLGHRNGKYMVPFLVLDFENIIAR